MDEEYLHAIALHALEEAGMAGLCREGQQELARERLAAVLPAHERHRIDGLIVRAQDAGQAAPP